MVSFLMKSPLPSLQIQKSFGKLSHLATLERHGALDDIISHVEAIFSNKEIIKKSKILPFRFIEAIKHINNAKAQDALRDALELSFESIPDIHGRTAVLLDCSPSMKYKYRNDEMMQTAAVFAIAVMKKANNNGSLICFDGKAARYNVSLCDSMLTQADAISKWTTGGATNPSAGLEILLDAKEKVDNLIVITDGEQNRGAPFADVLAKYKATVNAKVKVFIMDVSPNLDAITPDDSNVTYIYGWSDEALKFISLASNEWGHFVNEALKVVLT